MAAGLCLLQKFDVYKTRHKNVSSTLTCSVSNTAIVAKLLDTALINFCFFGDYCVSNIILLNVFKKVSEAHYRGNTDARFVVLIKNQNSALFYGTVFLNTAKIWCDFLRSNKQRNWTFVCIIFLLLIPCQAFVALLSSIGASPIFISYCKNTALFICCRASIWV